MDVTLTIILNVNATTHSAHGAVAKGTAHGRNLSDFLKSLSHSLDAFIRISQVCHGICTLKIMQLLHGLLESLFTLVINLSIGRLLVDHGWCLGSLNRFLLRGTWLRDGILLTLLRASGWLFSGWWGSTGTPGCAWVIVYTLHVVIKVPAAWETIASDAALAAVILAKERLIPMSMHGVGFSLMAE